MDKALFVESVRILANNEPGTIEYANEAEEIRAVLEDVNSPVTRKYHEKLFGSVLNKAHIDFGDIPKSEGYIKQYKGYPAMAETLEVVKKLALEEHNKEVLKYVATITKTIEIISELSATYHRGFTTRTEYVALEYNTYVYFCVEATTALLYSFVEWMRSPETGLFELKIKNTKLRADDFYFTQLTKFNAAQDRLGIEYRKMLESLCDKGKDNFIGIAEIIGVGAVAAVAMAIVPLSREILYQIYRFRGKISEHLEVQANFLELNKSCVENNEAFDAAKKKKILDKQAKLIKKLTHASDAIRVKSSKAIMDSKRELSSDNKRLSISNIRDEVSNSPFEIL